MGNLWPHRALQSREIDSETGRPDFSPHFPLTIYVAGILRLLVPFTFKATIFSPSIVLLFYFAISLSIERIRICNEIWR